MFYTVASPEWKPGQPMTLSATLLFRTKAEAESFAPEASTVALAIRFDESRGLVHPHGPVARATAGGWSAPALGNSRGGLTVLGSIPSSLVRATVEVEGYVSWRPPIEDESPHSERRGGFSGWDSLTMALLA
jgi:hypothetical protein